MKFFNTVQYDGKQTAEMLGESVAQYCVTHLTGVPENIDLKEFYAELGGSLGLLVLKDEDPETGLLQDGSWSDIRFNEKKSKDAYRYSNKHHSLHTDYSYVPITLDMTFFFCMMQASFGGATIFVDPAVLEEALKLFDPKLYRNLCSTELLLSKDGSSQQVGKQVTVMQHDEDGLVLNWNYHRAQKAKGPAVREMVESFHAFLESKVLLGGLYHGVRMFKGEGCFIHDRRVLHGRLSFIGQRHLCKGAIVLNDPEKASRDLSNYPHAS